MMRMLVSVRDVPEALLAAHGGADFIDLKEPRAGALGGLPSRRSLRSCARCASGAAPAARFADQRDDRRPADERARRDPRARRRGRGLRRRLREGRHRARRAGDCGAGRTGRPRPRHRSGVHRRPRPGLRGRNARLRAEVSGADGRHRRQAWRAACSTCCPTPNCAASSPWSAPAARWSGWPGRCGARNLPRCMRWPPTSRAFAARCAPVTGAARSMQSGSARSPLALHTSPALAPV